MKSLRLVAATGFSLAAILVAAPGPGGSMSAEAKPSGAFRDLGGVWRGAGRILLADGSSQRIRCNAYYRVLEDGAELGLAIRCAATDNRIELRASVSDSHGRLSGSWEERTFNATGEISGRAQPGAMNLSINGAVVGSMRISYSGRRQTVDIATGTEGLKGISIQLSR